jgi:hypothetical protein
LLLHGENGYSSLNFDDRLRRDVQTHEHLYEVVAQQCRRLGVAVDTEQWKSRSWTGLLCRAAHDIEALVPLGQAFILVDENRWKTDPSLAGRPRIPFMERDGDYWGRPPDDSTAISEIERLRKAGASFMVFAWPAFWWLDYYSQMQQHLRQNFRCVQESDRLVVFDLRREDIPA